MAHLEQVGAHSAEAAGEQAVGLLQLGRRTALGTLVFDQQAHGAL
jgi:hypothetical protein